MLTTLSRSRPVRSAVGIFAVLMLLVTGSRIAFASQLVHVKQASLDDRQSECTTIGGSIDLWHFIINNVEEDPPATISVSWDSGATEDVPLEKLVGGAAHYTTTLHPGELVTDATAVVPDDWTGQFVLSHVGCDDPPDPTSSSVTTEVHLGTTDGATPVEVTNAAPAPLGSSVHDSVLLDTDPTATELPSGSSVALSFWATNDCSGTAQATTSEGVGGATTPVAIDPMLAQGPLAAGGYSYRADFTSGDPTAVDSATGACEPFTISKADTVTTTAAFNAAGVDITNGVVQTGTVVHDHAMVGPQVGDFAITGTITYSLFGSSDCTGATVIPDETVPVGTDSTPFTIATPGYYGYLATYNGDSNYNGSTGVCEPFAAYQPGMTMGFWGNKIGDGRITAGGGYGANSILLGRGALIDTRGEALKVLPTTLNACGKGSTIIFSDQTSTKDCSVATGLNKSSLNTLSAQTLALNYNIKLVSGYSGQSIGLLQCSAYLPVGTLSPTSTVNETLTAAVALINASASGGSTTQAQVGAMNSLLGCLNREA